MVNNCVAYACHNIQDSRIPIAYHTFPFKRPDILNLWVKAIRRVNWFPSKNSRLCSEHFLESDYRIRPGYPKLLNSDAVPSIFSFPRTLPFDKYNRTVNRKVVTHEIVDVKVEAEEPIDIDFDPSQCISDEESKVCINKEIQSIERNLISTPNMMDSECTSVVELEMLANQETLTVDGKLFKVKTVTMLNLPCPSLVESKVLIDQETQTMEDKLVKTHSNACEKLVDLKRQVKTLKQIVKRRDLKISRLNKIIREILVESSYKADFDEITKKYFEG